VYWLYCYKSTNTDAAAAGPSNVSARPRHLLDFTLRPPGVVGLPPDVSPACSRRAAERPDAGAAGAAGHGTSAPTSEWKGGDAGRRDDDTGSAGATRAAAGAGGGNKGSASVDVRSAVVDVRRFRNALHLLASRRCVAGGKAIKVGKRPAMPASDSAVTAPMTSLCCISEPVPSLCSLSEAVSLADMYALQRQAQKAPGERVCVGEWMTLIEGVLLRLTPRSGACVGASCVDDSATAEGLFASISTSLSPAIVGLFT
jgi:hypothetical protein